MVASDYVAYSAYQYAAVLPAAVAGVGLHVDTTAYVLLVIIIRSPHFDPFGDKTILTAEANDRLPIRV